MTTGDRLILTFPDPATFVLTAVFPARMKAGLRSRAKSRRALPKNDVAENATGQMEADSVGIAPIVVG